MFKQILSILHSARRILVVALEVVTATLAAITHMVNSTSPQAAA